MAWVEYIRRMKRDAKFQVKAFGLVVDWTVFIYILIPILIALGVIDYRLWQAAPDWTSLVPVSLFGLCLFFAAQVSSVRTYVEQADELFVIQNLKYYQALIQTGKCFTVLKTVLETAMLIFYILPIFKVGYQLSNHLIVLIYCYVILWSLFQKLASRWFSLRGFRWRGRIFSVLALVFYGMGFYGLFEQPVLFAGITLIIFAITLFLLKKEKQPLRFFHAEVERERNEKWKWAILFMMRSGEVESIKKMRKYPFLNKHSRPIFSERWPEKVLVEMYWKWHIRKGRQLKFYLYFISVAFYAMVIVPQKVKFIVLLFILFAAYKIQEGIWKSFITHPFKKNMGNLNEITIAKAKKRALMVTWLVPSGVLIIWAAFLIL